MEYLKEPSQRASDSIKGQGKVDGNIKNENRPALFEIFYIIKLLKYIVYTGIKFCSKIFSCCCTITGGKSQNDSKNKITLKL